MNFMLPNYSNIDPTRSVHFCLHKFQVNLHAIYCSRSHQKEPKGTHATEIIPFIKLFFNHILPLPRVLRFERLNNILKVPNISAESVHSLESF